MLFNVEYDHGNLIEGYFIPDGFSGRTQIEVSDRDGVIGCFPCNFSRPAVAQAGRHETGNVGFKLDENLIPGLSSLSSLEIRDANTGLLIYRRKSTSNFIELKIFRLETQILPLLKFDQEVGRNFQYESAAIERFGQETAFQMFLLHEIDSVYLSGRLQMRSFEDYLNKGFHGIVSLSDPYDEMAMRIYLLKRLSPTLSKFFGERDRLALEEAAAHFLDADIFDTKTLKHLIQRAPRVVTGLLTSPVTKQLVAASDDQRITRRDIAPALDLLSRFKIVGHSSNSEAFQVAVAQLTGLSRQNLPVPSLNHVLSNIAATLRTLPAAESMLENDLILDHYVRQAIA